MAGFHRFSLSVALCALLLIPVAVRAQVAPHGQAPSRNLAGGGQLFSIEGAVLAEDGRTPVNMAQVVLADIKGRQWGSQTTGSEGSFQFSDVPPGSYILSITHVDYPEMTERVDVSVAPVQGLRITLRGAAPRTGAPSGQTLPVWEQNIPKDAQKEYEAGLEQSRAGKREESIQHFETAAKLYPQYASALAAMGAMQLALGKHQEAIAAFEAALKIDDNLPAANLGLGALYNAEKRPQDAEKYLLRARLLKPDDWRVHHELGEAYIRLEQWANAEASLRHAIELHNSFPRTHLLLINALSMQQKYQESLTEMDDYLNLMPNDSFAAQVREKRKQLKAFLDAQAPPASPEPQKP
jgi:tetratricopeptide (TPR) repeat protein